MSTYQRGILNQVATDQPVAPAKAHPPTELIPTTPAKSGGPKRKWTLLALAVVLVVAAVSAALMLRARRPQSSNGTALLTVKAERRTFLHAIRLSGTVEAVHSSAILAPQLAGEGGDMVLTKLTPAGTRVKNGDLLAEFDRQTQIKNFLDKQAEFRDLENQIASKKAEQAAAKAQDDTDLKAAEDAVGTARLETQKNEIASRIDAEKNQLNLEAAEANLKQLRHTYDLKRNAAAAELHILELKRDRARSTMEHSQQNSEMMSIRSPIDGLVVLNPIWKGSGMGEVQEGDQVWPGFPFMQVVDSSLMQVRVRVNQLDIHDLHVGQKAQIHLDAYSDLILPGTLDQLAAIGLGGGLSKTVHTFAAVFSISGSDPRLMPDLSASVDVELDRQPNALVVPRDSVVTIDGKPFVYAKSSLGFERRAVKTGDSNDMDIVITSGLEPGTEIERRPPVGGGSSA